MSATFKIQTTTKLTSRYCGQIPFGYLGNGLKRPQCSQHQPCGENQHRHSLDTNLNRKARATAPRKFIIT